MGIHVIQSHKIEHLLEAVMTQLNQPAESVFDIFQTQTFIVPNQSVEKWLTQKIAQITGVTANYEYFNKISSFQWKIYQKVNLDKDKVSKSLMPRTIIKWRIFEAIKPHITNEKITMSFDAPLFAIVSRIYESAKDITDANEAFDKRSGMLYWVADQVSRLFTNYMTYRSDCDKHVANCNCKSNWLKSWSMNKPIDIESLFNGNKEDLVKLQQVSNLEEWQRWLWVNLFADEYERFKEVDRDFWSVLDDVSSRRNALASLPTQVIVFTLVELPPQQLKFLRRLGEYTEVKVFHYNPTHEYWADSVDPKWKQQYDLKIKERFIEQNFLAGKATNDVELKEYFNRFELNFNAESRESRHPLLTRLGKQARDNFSLLSALSSGDEGGWFDLFQNDQDESTLLGKIKADIFNLAEPEKNGYPLVHGDKSIQINACHSPIRQLEALKEQILHWLDQGTSDAPRSLEDILVVAPDIKAIEPHIRSVFAPFAKSGSVGETYLPIKITGVAQSTVANAWASVLGRITLTQGRFQFEDFCDWLMLPATQKLYQLKLSEVDRISELLKQARFIRGFDADHLKQGLPSNDDDCRFSFKYALDRLTLGVFTHEHSVFDDVLGVDFVQSGDFDLIGKLHVIFNDLLERQSWLMADTQGKTADKWFETILIEIKMYQDMGEEYLDVVSDVISGLLRPLSMSVYYDFSSKRSTASLVGFSLPLKYILDEIQHGLDSQLESAEPSGHITFCQIGYIRPLPYKLVVALNMDGNAFPSYPSNNSFDLISMLRPVLGDRSRLEDEQGAFLDAVLLAGEAFWVFYNGFDLNSGQIRQPSSVVQDLIDHLAVIVRGEHGLDLYQYASIKGIDVPEHLTPLFIAHDLHPFDSNGFGEGSVRLKNQWHSIACKLQSGAESSQPWVDDVYMPAQHSKVTILSSHWSSDITFPARLFLKSLAIKNYKPDDVVPDNEPLLLKGLDDYFIRDFMLKNRVEDSQLLEDRLPIGKLKESAWLASQSQYSDILGRLSFLGDQPTPTHLQQIVLADDLVVGVQLPKDSSTSRWVVLKSSSAYADHRAATWIDYLLWMQHLDLGENGSERAMVVVFKNETIVNSGLTSAQAKECLGLWVAAWNYGQQNPLVLPAKLLLAPIEKNKKLQWSLSEEDGVMKIDQMDDLLKVWNETYSFSSDFPLSENKANKKHRDWQYILKNQNSNNILIKCCDMFGYGLYSPIYEHQVVFSDVEFKELGVKEGV